MAIKKLQNDHTSPEQSKRLLELGVPLNSANCIREVRTGMVFFMQDGRVTEGYLSLYNSARGEEAEPCWSAGRLMEIYGICMGVEGFFYCKGNFIDEAVRRIEGSVKNNLLDFSKLEG
jgi:hypothetical protein